MIYFYLCIILSFLLFLSAVYYVISLRSYRKTLARYINFFIRIGGISDEN